MQKERACGQLKKKSEEYELVVMVRGG